MGQRGSVRTEDYLAQVDVDGVLQELGGLHGSLLHGQHPHGLHAGLQLDHPRVLVLGNATVRTSDPKASHKPQTKRTHMDISQRYSYLPQGCGGSAQLGIKPATSNQQAQVPNRRTTLLPPQCWQQRLGEQTATQNSPLPHSGLYSLLITGSFSVSPQNPYSNLRILVWAI